MKEQRSRKYRLQPQLGAVVQEFEEHLRGKKKQSSSTVSGYLQRIRRFGTYLTRPDGCDLKSWHQVTLAVAQEYFQHLHETETATRTINLTITALRMFFDFLVLRGDANSNPFYVLQHETVPPSAPPTLTDKDIRLLVGAPACLWQEVLTGGDAKDHCARDFGEYKAARDEAIIRLIFFGGLKTGEVVSLVCGDFDFDTSVVTVANGQKARSIFLLPTATAVLQKSIHLKSSLFINSEPAFINHRGKQLTARSVERLVKAYAAWAGVRADITPRHLRRSFERHLIKADAEEWLIQYLLGHQYHSTTQTLITQMRMTLGAVAEKIEEPMRQHSHTGNPPAAGDPQCIA